MLRVYRELWKHNIEMRIVPIPGTVNAVNIYISKNGYERELYVWAMPYDEGFSRHKTDELVKMIRDFARKLDKLEELA